MVLGVIYQNMNMLDSALYYQQRSLDLKETYGMMNDLPISLNNVAELYASLGQSQKAMETIDRSIRLADSLHIADALAYAQHVKGTLYNKNKKYEEALVWLLPASRFWENRRTYDDLKQSYHEIVTAYAGEGNYRSAYEYLQRERAASDSVMNEVKLKNASDLEAKYQNEKDALEIARQKAENEVVENQKKNQFTIFILVAVFLVIYALVFYSRYKKQKKDKELIALQKVQLEVRNKDMEDSISYSSKVQQSIFPSVSDFAQSFRDSFILFRPKEKVSGDFYWYERRAGLVLFAAADCTGHGVPGAMVSVVCSGALNRAVKEFGITDPGKILDKARELVLETFEKSETEVKDGMDISFCVFDPQKRELFWAGANNPLWIIRQNGSGVEQIDPNKQPIGRHSSALPFTTHRIELHSGDLFYVFTDGYADQFGGEKGKKFKAAKMKELLLQVRDQSLEKQKQALAQAFDNWRGELEQIDDVCIIGVLI
jgi:serine phosphatase RsbU (regulator of sigma subunit)